MENKKEGFTFGKFEKLVHSAFETGTLRIYGDAQCARSVITGTYDGIRIEMSKCSLICLCHCITSL